MRGIIELSRRLEVIVGCASVLLAAVVTILAQSHYFHDYRWPAFIAWLFATCGLFLFFAIREFNPRELRAALSTPWRITILCILVGTIATRLYALDDYPFMAINDEVLGGGLFAQDFARGARDDFFGYYLTAGLTSGGLCGLFYFIFGESLLTYRVPAAIFSMAIIAMTVTFGVRHFGAAIGVLSGAALICLPLEAHYARTQTVLVLTEICGLAIFMALCALYRERTAFNFLTIGITAGFAVGLHMSVYPIAYVSLLFAGCFALRSRLTEAAFAGRPQIFLNLGAIVVGLMVGMGPRVFTVRFDHLVGADRLMATGVTNVSLSEYARRYWSALRVYFDSDLTFFYTGIFLTPALGTIMFIGALSVIARPSFVKLLTLCIVLLIPLTNSAVTNGLNYSHRMLVAAPFVAITIALGCGAIVDALRRFRLGLLVPLLAGCFVLYLGSILREYFVSERDTEPLNQDHVQGYYLLRHSAEYMAPYREFLPRQLCLRVCPTCDIFHAKHSVELMSFFFPDVRFEVGYDAAIASYKDIGISEKCDPLLSEEESIVMFCNQPVRYRCPVGLSPLRLRVQKSLIHQRP